MEGRKVRLTPKGLFVSLRTSRMLSRSFSGLPGVSPVNKPSPPAFDTAATSLGIPTHIIPCGIRPRRSAFVAEFDAETVVSTLATTGCSSSIYYTPITPSSTAQYRLCERFDARLDLTPTPSPDSRTIVGLNDEDGTTKWMITNRLQTQIRAWNP